MNRGIAMSGPWAARRARATALSGVTPHASEILECYAEVLSLQSWISERIPVEGWQGAASVDRGAERPGTGPRLRLARLPLDEVVPLFDELLARATDVGTSAMRQEAAHLQRAPASERAGSVAHALTADRSVSSTEQSFHAHLYAEVVATRLSAGIVPARVSAEDPSARVCPVCGDTPIAAVLRDDDDALGARFLTCGRCATEWRADRLSCAGCGEISAEALTSHAAASVPHVRLQACASCNQYLKVVDLRINASAVPAVDDVATVELDLWASDRGLRKLRTNLFGL